jgi:hypothetical protein
MAIILEAAVGDEEQQTVARSTPSLLDDQLATLLPPELLPPPHDDRSLVSRDGLDTWRAGFERTVNQLTRLADEQPELWSSPKHAGALAFALSRWLPAEEAEEEEGWLLDARVRMKVKGTCRRHYLPSLVFDADELVRPYIALLNRLPPPELLSLKPIFQATPPPQLSTTSFRALPKPVYDDDVMPERETWRATAGWGTWNVLRRAIEGLDVSGPCLPFPFSRDIDARRRDASGSVCADAHETMR